MRLQSALPALLLVCPLAGCLDTDPPIPDRRILSGSDWIPGRSRTSLVTEGQPIEVHNAGPGLLVIGEGPGAISLAPGAVHRTNGEDLELHNPGEEEARVHMAHWDEGMPREKGVPVVVRRGDRVQTVYTRHRDAMPLPLATQPKLETVVEPR